MRILYSIGIFLLRSVYRVASLFHPKAKAFVNGRRDQKEKLRNTFPSAGSDQLVWFHCASLGEFEQGRPVIEALKASVPSIKILLTFFSPSGYEVRKNYAHADYVFYLPWDTASNAKDFIQKIKPSLAVFVKYEFWYFYAKELKENNIPLISISTILRADQIFFKPYGKLFRSLLRNFSHFFVQNQESAHLLQSIGINSVTLTGDTRFDRVYQIVQQAEEIPHAKNFKGGKALVVIGSAWPEDMEVLYSFINERTDLKFIIAPHEISENFLYSIEKAIEGKTVRFSTFDTDQAKSAQVLLIDNIGLLSRLYRYGEFAFVGGAFGDGLHNILEAACYGVPIFFGNKAYEKYEEATQLIALGGAFEVGNFIEFRSAFDRINNNAASYQLSAEVTRQYVADNLGATEKIVTFCKKILA